MKAVLGALLLALSLTAQAETYLAIQAGQSWQTIDKHPGAVLTAFDAEDTSTSGRIALGYAADWWGVEFGYSPRLSARDGHAVIAPDIDVRQYITTAAADVRAHVGVSLGRDLQARFIGGAAFVYFENHEVGHNPEPVEWRNSGVALAPLFGLGARYRVNERIAITVDATQINGVAKSHWTMDSKITTLLAGVQVRF